MSESEIRMKGTTSASGDEEKGDNGSEGDVVIEIGRRTGNEGR